MFLRVLLTAALLCLPSFSQSASFNMIKMSTSFAPKGDFNNDGREDGILFTQTPNAFHAEISTGTGTYTEVSSYALPNNEGPQVYAVGDFNNDGKLDVAIVTAAKKLYVYRGTGDGKFEAPVTTSLPFLPSAMQTADVNHDGKMDLVLVNSPSGANSTLVTYFGNGSGGFTAGPSSDFGSQYNILGVGDFDGDGKADVASANCGPGGCILWVYYGDGAGHFGSPVNASASQGGFVIADADLDGKSDIIAVNTGYINAPDEPFLTIYYGSANRTLQSANVPLTLCATGTPTVADFNGDGIPDIVFTEHTCSQNSFTESNAPAQIAFLPGLGNRTFGTEQALFNSTYGQQANVDAQLLRGNNSDAKPDFMFSQLNPALTATETYLMVNTSSGAFSGCRAPNSSRGFRICSPLSGATVSSPVKFSFGASWTVPVRKAEVWVDGVKKFQSRDAWGLYGFADTTLTLSPGTHVITIDTAGWDNSTQSKKYSITVK